MLRVSFTVKLFSHTSHTKGRSPSNAQQLLSLNPFRNYFHNTCVNSIVASQANRNCEYFLTPVALVSSICPTSVASRWIGRMLHHISIRRLRTNLLLMTWCGCLSMIPPSIQCCDETLAAVEVHITAISAEIVHHAVVHLWPCYLFSAQELK